MRFFQLTKPDNERRVYQHHPLAATLQQVSVRSTNRTQVLVDFAQTVTFGIAMPIRGETY